MDELYRLPCCIFQARQCFQASISVISTQAVTPGKISYTMNKACIDTKCLTKRGNLDWNLNFWNAQMYVIYKHTYITALRLHECSASYRDLTSSIQKSDRNCVESQVNVV